MGDTFDTMAMRLVEKAVRSCSHPLDERGEVIARQFYNLISPGYGDKCNKEKLVMLMAAYRFGLIEAHKSIDDKNDLEEVIKHIHDTEGS